jgi:hypothetical protein
VCGVGRADGDEIGSRGEQRLEVGGDSHPGVAFTARRLGARGRSSSR